MTIAGAIIGLSVRLRAYCNRDCRRQAAYGRERFKNCTKGRRKRRLEASDKLPGTLVAGSFRNGDFSSVKIGCYKPTNWIEKLNQRHANEIDRAYWNREKRYWPADLMGGARHSDERPTLTVDPKLRQTILDTERLLKDDEPTRYALLGDEIKLDDDGYLTGSLSRSWLRLHEPSSLSSIDRLRFPSAALNHGGLCHRSRGGCCRTSAP